MECTEEMLIAAVKKAVEVGLIPKYAIGEETYLQNWNSVKAIVEAALLYFDPEPDDPEL